MREDYRNKIVNFSKRADDVACYKTLIPNNCKYKGLNVWNQNDYSVPVCDGYCWDLRLFSGKKIIRKISGTVEAPPLGEQIQSIISEIVGEDYLYIF